MLIPMELRDLPKERCTSKGVSLEDPLLFVVRVSYRRSEESDEKSPREEV